MENTLVIFCYRGGGYVWWSEDNSVELVLFSIELRWSGVCDTCSDPLSHPAGPALVIF